MEIITLNLPLINNVEIHIKNKQLAQFAARQLRNYVINQFEQNEKTKAEFSIKIKDSDFLSSVENVFDTEIVIGRSHIIKKSETLLPKFKYEYSKDCLKITSSNKIKWYKKFTKFTYRKCNMQFYNNILFPIFSLYTMLDNYVLVHGSLLEYENKNIIISGLDGVGKSTIASMLTEKGAKLYADNFVLFNGEKSIPINLAMRLFEKEQTNLEIIYHDKKEKLKEALPSDIKNNPVKIDDIYFLNMKKELVLNKIELNNPNAWYMICNMASEIRDANMFVSAFLYNGFQIKYDNRFKFYNLSIPKGKLKEGVELISNEH